MRDPTGAGGDMADEWMDLTDYLDLADLGSREGQWDEMQSVVEDGLSVVTVDDLIDSSGL